MNLHRRFLVIAGMAISPAIFAADAAPKVGVLLKSHVQFWTAVEKGALEAGARAKAEVGTFPQALADQAKRDGWIVISMKDDWRRIFAFEP